MPFPAKPLPIQQRAYRPRDAAVFQVTKHRKEYLSWLTLSNFPWRPAHSMLSRPHGSPDSVQSVSANNENFSPKEHLDKERRWATLTGGFSFLIYGLPFPSDNWICVLFSCLPCFFFSLVQFSSCLWLSNSSWLLSPWANPPCHLFHRAFSPRYYILLSSAVF